ncbi:TPA: hypothetical protein MNN17_004409, partial [Citrobacter freundii]|nr:hypothetical protein [Citrobacter freundii]HBZ9475447.1 hypothetical protein [Citrobacter freundii]HCA1386268.1 hypothetical protein [Citrobacter freundii]HCA2023006.1 hypothetical protein [Citrobacter freundii]
PREIVKSALRHNAAALILAHNHPSGITDASKADRTITSRIVNVLALVDIRVLDHFIIGDGDVLSFAERGWLQESMNENHKQTSGNGDIPPAF